MSRQKPWRAENPDAVIVARPSKWGNPYRVTGGVTPASQAVTLFADFIERCSRSNIEPRVQNDGLGVWNRDIKTNIVAALEGRDLACWCALDQPCHADVLLEIANPELNGSES